jgi:hypothetical protein
MYRPLVGCRRAHFATSQPPSLHRPPKRDAFQTGRAQLIDDCVAALLDAGCGAICIRGMGGQGKTTLAKAVVNDRRTVEHFPDRVVWIPCEVTTSLDALRTALAAALGWTNPQLCGTVDGFQAALDAEKRSTLLVLDNFETVRDAPGPADDPYLPSAEASALLVALLDVECIKLVLTMRGNVSPRDHPRWSDLVLLEGLSPTESEELFVKIARPTLLAVDDSVALAELLVELDGHPLSIKLLAFNNAREKRPLGRLLADFTAKRNDILALPSHERAQRGTHAREGSVDASIAVSFESQLVDEAGRLLLQLLAFCRHPIRIGQLVSMTRFGADAAADQLAVLVSLSLVREE